MSWSHSPGSARVSRVGDGVLAIANFPFATQPAPARFTRNKRLFWRDAKTRAPRRPLPDLLN